MQRAGFLLLAVFAVASVWAQAQAPPSNKEVVVVRGKSVGFTSVSPALQAVVEKKYGKKSNPDSNAAGPNMFVGKHGFVRLSPAETKGAATKK